MPSRLQTTFRLLAALGLAAIGGFAAETQRAPLPDGVKRLNIPGVHNAFAIGTNLLSGGTPETDEAYAALRVLGVKTIISVDGAPPDLDAARRHGLRYVHLPCGYDGIATNRQQQLARAAGTLPGPFFVHCHHGEHRGPAATAIMALAGEHWTANVAEAWLHAAGTGTNYPGLYASVRAFRPPSTDVQARVPDDFPERAPASGLVEAMVEIDTRWERLKAFRAAGGKPARQASDIDAAHELNLLREHFREAQRLPQAAALGNEFLGLLKQSEHKAQSTGQLLQRSPSRPEMERAFDVLRADCTKCHRRYRDERIDRP